MKRTMTFWRAFCVVAIIALTGFGMAACDTGGGTGNQGGGNVSLEGFWSGAAEAPPNLFIKAKVFGTTMHILSPAAGINEHATLSRNGSAFTIHNSLNILIGTATIIDDSSVRVMLNQNSGIPGVLELQRRAQSVSVGGSGIWFARISGGYEAVGRPVTGGTLNIPATHNGLPVIAIGYRAFMSYGLSSVVIPNSVRSIGIVAFAWNNLLSLTIPSSVMYIENSAFMQNDNLASMTIPFADLDTADMAWDHGRLSEGNWRTGIPANVTWIFSGGGNIVNGGSGNQSGGMGNPYGLVFQRNGNVYRVTQRTGADGEQQLPDLRAYAGRPLEEPHLLAH